MRTAFAIALCSLSFLSLSAHAESLAGVRFSDEVNVGSQSLKLNGLGLREATIFRVDVYVAGLYLAESETNPKKILSSKDAKHLRIVFVRAVSGDDLDAACDAGFRANCKDIGPLKDRIAKLKQFLGDFRRKDVIAMTFEEKRVVLVWNDKKRCVIEGGDFSRALLSIWIGNTPYAGLKRGLLGGSR